MTRIRAAGWPLPAARRLLAAGVIAVSALVAAGAARAESRALLVGVSDYPSLPAGFSPTPGARNDVDLLRRVLVQRGFRPSNIRVLADGLPGAQQPTRAHILRALDDLVAASAPGDRVVLHLAGHGSLEPATPPERGTSPIFLPIDIGRWDGGTGRVDNAITRADLRQRVDQLTARGAFVWGIFDTCHAAALVREPAAGAVRARFVQPALLGVPHGAAGLPSAGRARPPSLIDTPGPPPPGPGGAVFFYAAQAGEPAVELPQRLPDGSTRVHGLFTSQIAKALQGQRPVSYRQLGQAILAAYATAPGAYSTPQFTGDALDRRVLGQETVPLHQWPLRTEGGLHVDAGALWGLASGAVLAVVDGPLAPEHAVLGHLRVATVDAGRAMLEPAQQGSHAPIEPAVLRPGHYLRLVHSPPAFGLRVAYAPAHCGRGCRLTDAVARLREQGVPGVDLQWVDAAGQPDVVLRLREGRVELAASAPQIGGDAPPAGFLLDPAEAAPMLAQRLARGLHGMARARNILLLAGLSARDGPSTGLLVEARRSRAPGQAEEVLRPDATTTVFGGEWLVVRLDNDGAVPLDVTVLGLDAHHGVTVIHPGADGESNRLPAGAGREVRHRVGQAVVPGRERIVVITRPARAGSERADFSFLAQPSLTRLRGPGSGDVDLFADAAFAEYRRRGLAHPRLPGGVVDVRVFAVDVATGPRRASSPRAAPR